MNENIKKQEIARELREIRTRIYIETMQLCKLIMGSHPGKFNLTVGIDFAGCKDKDEIGIVHEVKCSINMEYDGK